MLGSGASSIQTVPTMQPHVKHMDIFVRTGVWFVQIANNFGQNKVYTEEEKEKFRNDPKSMLAHAKDIENQINGLNQLIYHGSEAQQMARKLFSERMKEHIKDERLLKGFTPTWDVACKFLTPYFPSLIWGTMGSLSDKAAVSLPVIRTCKQSSNPTSTSISRTSLTSPPMALLVPTAKRERWTPSSAPLVSTFRIGQDSLSLARTVSICRTSGESPQKATWAWERRICQTSSFSLARPGKCRRERGIGWLLLIVCRPVENGSVAGPLKAVGEYTIKLIKKLQRDHIKSMTPSQSKTDAFNLHAQEWIKYTVWKDDCRSWYKDNDTGRVNAVWPGSSLHYMAVLEHPRWEDWDIEYMNANPFAALGKGRTWRDETQGADLSPYLTKHGVDEKWMEAVGSSRAKMVEGEMTVTEEEEMANAKASAAKAEVGSTFAHV